MSFRWKIISATLAAAISVAFLGLQARPDGKLHVYFLNVGQGDSILLRTPDGANILVDGGPGTAVIDELSDTLPYFDRELDAVFLTHTDRDHLEGLIAVLRKLPVKKIYISGRYGTSELVREFFRIIQEKQIPIVAVDKSTDPLFDDVKADILWPFTQMVIQKEKTNNDSIVMNVRYGNNKILLTGDIEKETEYALLKAHADVDTDMLKVAHHGSLTSTTEAFLDAASPLTAIISVGKNNQFRHPRPETIKHLRERKIPIYRTDVSGRIELVFSAEKLETITPARGE